MDTLHRKKPLKKKPQSSLSSLPSSSSKHQSINQRYKSIKKTQQYDEQKEKEDKDYDSTDSLDQLLDHNFIPEKSKPNHMKVNKSNTQKTPRKNLNVTGSKRSKILALMATSQSIKNNKNKRIEYKSIQKKLKYITPKPMKRKVITPSITPFVFNNYNNNNNFVTPKINQKDLLNLSTPATVTPTKLFKKLNVKTPKTKSTKSTDKLVSWKDIDSKDKNNSNHDQSNNDLNDLNEFDNLCLRASSLNLPISFNLLITKFSALESCLSLYQRRNIFFVNFVDIKNSVQKISKKTFNKYDLKQILTFIPDLYNVQWTPIYNKKIQKKELILTLSAINNYNPYNDKCINIPFKDKEKDKDNSGTDDESDDVGLKFLKIAKINERQKIFRLRLIQFIDSVHNKFLLDNMLVEFDPFSRGKWHKKFDLENVGNNNNIKLISLPLKPVKTVNEIEKMIINQRKKLEKIIKNEIIKQKKEKQLNENDDNNDKNDKNDKFDKNNKISKNLSHLSPEFIARIRAKNKNKMVNCKLFSSKNDNDKNGDKKKDLEIRRIQQLPYLITLIRGIYISQKKGSFSFNSLINLIKKRHQNKFILNEEIEKQLEILNNLKSKFFKIKQGSVVKYAKLNKKILIKDVLKEINNKKN